MVWHIAVHTAKAAASNTMNTGHPPRTNTYAGAATPSAWSWMPLALVAVAASAFGLHAIVYGPAIRERAERLQAEQIDRENRALCQKLGMPDGSERFAACIDILSEARRLEATRIADQSQGIL